jgi:hypothetical protein
MNRRSKHRIWLRDIHPYVFCDNYKKRHQLRRDGEFEIYFVNEEGSSSLLNTLSRAADIWNSWREYDGITAATNANKEQLHMLSKKSSEASRRRNPSLTMTTTTMTTITKSCSHRDLPLPLICSIICSSLVGLRSISYWHGKRGVVGLRPSHIPDWYTLNIDNNHAAQQEALREFCDIIPFMFFPVVSLNN